MLWLAPSFATPHRAGDGQASLDLRSVRPRLSRVRRWAFTAAALVLISAAVTRTSPSVAAVTVPTAAVCSEQAVAAVVNRFVRAFNRGETRELDRMWSRAHFRWYSATQVSPVRRHHAVYSRSRLVRYFWRRYTTGERLALVTFRFNGVGGVYANFEYSVRRRARDLSTGRWRDYEGKGAVYCGGSAPSLTVWSMGTSAKSFRQPSRQSS